MADRLAKAEARIASLEAEIDVARVNSADSDAQIRSARENIGNLERQLEAARLNADDAVRQIVLARRERERLLGQIELWRQRAGSAPPRWRRWLTGRPEGPIPEATLQTRRRLGRRYLRGEGIEIGALHSPIPVSRQARVTYVDRMSREELLEEYAEQAEHDFVRVDVIDDGETLSKFTAESLDFVVASHMLEHCENPLGTMRNHLTRLRSGGILFYALPDRASGFDADRPLTDFAHVVRDDVEGPEGSRWAHFLEFAELVERAPEAELEFVARSMMDRGASIHFHVWHLDGFREFLQGAESHLQIATRVEALEQNHAEIIAVIRKL
jgi:predicted SAM-dependent methyltransferase